MGGEERNSFLIAQSEKLMGWVSCSHLHKKEEKKSLCLVLRGTHIFITIVLGGFEDGIIK